MSIKDALHWSSMDLVTKNLHQFDKRNWNDLKNGVSRGALLGFKTLCDWLNGPQSSGRNLAVAQELTSRLVDMDPKKQLQILGPDLEALKTSLGEHNSLQKLCENIRDRLQNTRLHTCPLRRFFFIVLMFPRMDALWLPLRVAVRMFNNADELGVFDGTNTNAEIWFAKHYKDLLSGDLGQSVVTVPADPLRYVFATQCVSLSFLKFGTVNISEINKCKERPLPGTKNLDVFISALN